MGINVDFCRPKKAEDICNSTSEFFKRTGLRTEEYTNTVILPVRKIASDSPNCGLGGCLDEKGEMIALSATPRRIEKAYKPTDVSFEDKRVVYCDYFINHWGHFLMDSLVRMWYAVKLDDSVDEYVFAGNENGLTEKELYGNYHEFFELMGIVEKVRIITKPVQYRSVIIPEASYVYRRYWAEEHRYAFDKVIEQALLRNDKGSFGYTSKVFFSRSQFPKAQKSELGLDMLDNFFSKNGYSVVFPEKITLSKMICLINHADECAFESGTTPHNMLFSRIGKKTTIIERQSVVNNYQHDLDAIRELEVTYVDGFYTIYPVLVGGGPFFLTFNHCMKEFADKKGYEYPDAKYIEETAIKRNIKKYMEVYHNYYGQQWAMVDWMLNYKDAIFEAYQDSCKDLLPYLTGTKLYSWKQFVDFQNIKQWISGKARLVRKN